MTTQDPNNPGDEAHGAAGPIEALLSAPLQQRSAIIDGALDGIVMIDDQGLVLEFNRAAEQMFGYARDEAIGAQIVELIIPNGHRGQHEAGFDAYVNGGREARMIGRRIETEALRKNGETFPVELTIVETAGTDRPIFAGYLRDLTERREMEAKMARQRELINQNEKLGAMGTLLANVAHELNNPLSVVIGQAEILREQPLDAELDRQTDRILSAANRCAGIVHTLLAAVRQKPPVRRSFSAARPLHSSVDLVEHAYASAGIELTVDIAEDLPELFGDDGQIGQVLANLLTNAHQALSEEGATGTVAATVRPDGDGSSVVFSVGDSGQGIPEDLRSRIFEPFFTTKAEGTGTGVGLAIAHNIVTAHGGTLDVGTDAVLGGARFELRLPVNPCAAIAPRNETLSRCAPHHAQRRVLVVDDDADVAETIVELLDMHGMQADVAAGGDAALDMMEKVQYDFVLSDLRMPEVDGPTFFMRAQVQWPGIEARFGFVTGDTLNSGAAKFLAEAGVPVIEKPVTRENLLSIVSRIMARSTQ
jgi:two-component system NtrC family sensor kinase